jgi:hypothetical protein
MVQGRQGLASAWIIARFQSPKANREVVDDFQNHECTKTTQSLYRFDLTSLRAISRVIIYSSDAVIRCLLRIQFQRFGLGVLKTTILNWTSSFYATKTSASHIKRRSSNIARIEG